MTTNLRKYLSQEKNNNYGKALKCVMAKIDNDWFPDTINIAL